jgi:serine protease AprX
MSGSGLVQALPQQRTLRGWQWTTAVAGVLTVLAAMAPVTRQASTTVIQSTGRVEHMIVRAIPGHVHEAQRLVASAGGTVGRELSIISGFAAQVPADAVSGLRSAAGVVMSVDRDAPMKPLSVDPALGYDATGDFGSMLNVNKMVGAPALWANGYTGEGVDVALLDTGVAPVEGLSDKIVNGPDLSLDYQNGLPESVDAYGHGTHMAGIIAGHDADTTTLTDPTKFVGVAPDARIVNVKVGAADGSTDVSQVIAGIDWVVQHRNDNGMNIKVLNLSFGTLSKQSYLVDPLAYAAEVAWRRGVVVVAAAGNDGIGTKQLADPAYDPRLLAVGAFDPVNSLQPAAWIPADFTNYGSDKRDSDIFAPGMHILSLRDPGSYVDSNYPESQVGTRFTRGSGTSQAAAVMSGVVADLFDRYPNATPDMIKNVLVRTVTPFKGTPLTKLMGLDGSAGTVNAPKALTRSITSDGNGAQNFTYAKGTGSLELARGDMHLSNATSTLTGEQDIFGNAWDAQAWATAAGNGTSWQGGLWNGQRWSGDDWAGQRWSNAMWTANDWSGQRWSGQRWSGLVWDGQRWSGQRWSDEGWSGQRWSDQGWDGQRWSGQRWSNTLWG